MTGFCQGTTRTWVAQERPSSSRVTLFYLQIFRDDCWAEGGRFHLLKATHHQMIREHTQFLENFCLRATLSCPACLKLHPNLNFAKFKF